MPIAIHCPGCSLLLTLGDDWAGKTIGCPKCYTTFEVPAPEPDSSPDLLLPEPSDARTPDPRKVSFRCPVCRKKYKARAGDVGKRMECKLCGTVFVIPEPPPPVVPFPSPGDEKPEGVSPDPLPILPLPDSPPPDDPETPDDYVPPRRRKRWSASPLGLLFVGALGVAVLIALGVLALKVNRARELTAKREVRKTENSEKSPPSLTPPTGPQADNSQPTSGDKASLGESVAGMACMAFVVLIAGGCVWLLVSWVDVCPYCGRWKAVRCIGRRILERKKCFGIVIRRGHSTTAGAIYTSKGAVPTSSQTSSEWEERVPVIRTTYEYKMRCRFCRKMWFDEDVEEVEDFEPDEPLPPTP